MMASAFLNFCIFIAFPLVLILGCILLISGFSTLCKLIEDFCSDYPNDLEYFDEDYYNKINKEDKDNV